MAIPTAKATTIRPLTQVAPPKIYKAEVPSINLLGTPASDYQRYLKEKQQRSSWFFNSNDQGQVNSVADVVMNTVRNLWETATGEQTIGNTIRQTAEDSMNLVTNGIINPIIHKDYAALGLNQLINVGETVDIIDNIWKGFWIDGTEGAKRAAFDRYNYEWKTTGNFVGDFAQEVLLSPTNLITLGLGGLAKSTAKKAVTEAGQTLTGRVTKSLARNYTGDITTTIAKMQKNGLNLTANQVTQLQDVALHATNLKLLKSINTIKMGANFVDDIGPKLVYGSTFMPFKYMIQGGITAAAMPLKYMAQTLDRIDTNITTVNLVTNSAKYATAIKSLSDAAHIANIENIEIAPFEDIVSNVSRLEAKQFKQIFSEYNKIFTDKELVQNLIQEEAYVRGQAISFEAAEQMHISSRLPAFIETLDAKAVELSNGTFKNFDEYSAAVAKMYNAHSSGLGIESLYQYTQKLNKIRSHASINTLSSAFNPARSTLDDLAITTDNTIINGINEGRTELASQLDDLVKRGDNIRQEFYELFTKYNTTTDPALKEALAIPLRELRDTYGIVLDNSKFGRDRIAVTAIQAEYDALKVHMNTLDLTDTSNPVTYNAMLNLLKSRSYNLKTLEDSLKEVRVRVNDLQSQRALPEDWIEKANRLINKSVKDLKRVQNKFKYADKPPKVTAVTTLEDFKVPVEVLADYYKQYGELTNNIQGMLDNIFSVMTERESKEVFNDFVKRVMGSDGDGTSAIKRLVDSVENNLGKFRTTQQRSAIKNAVLIDGNINHQIIASLDTNVKVIESELVQVLDLLDDVELAHAVRDTLDEVNTMLVSTDMDAVNRVTGVLESLDELYAAADKIRKRIIDKNIRNGTATRTSERVGGDTGFSIEEAITSEEITVTPYPIIDTTRSWKESSGQLEFDLRKKPETMYVKTTTTVVKKVGKTVVEFTDDLATLESIMSIIDDTKRLFDVDDTITLELTKHNIREYQLQFNAVYKNLMVLNTDTVQAMLDMIDDGPEAYDPALKAMSGLAFFKLNKMSALTVAINDNDMVNAAKLYEQLTGIRGSFDPSKADTILELYDEVASLKNAALTIMDTLEGMASVRKLFTLIDSKSSLLGADTSNHLLDALQWYYDKPATLATGGDLTSILTEIKRNVNNQLRNSSNKHNFKLENWRKEFDRFVDLDIIPLEAKQEFDRLFPGDMSHTAIADSYTEYMLRRYVLKNDILPDTKLVYSDLETSTLNRYGSVIHQQSVVIPDTGVLKWYINTDIKPGQMADDEVLRIMFDNPEHPQYSMDYLRRLYEDVHVNGNIQALKNHFNILDDSPIEIIPIQGEADLILSVEDYIKTQVPASGRIQLAMYNGKDFDAELLPNRRRALGIQGWIKKDDVIDTRLDMEELMGVKRLSFEQEQAIEDIIYDYIAIRESELTVIANNRGTTLDSLYNLTGRGKFLPTVDETFSDALKRVNDYFSVGALSKGDNVLGKRYDVAQAVMKTKAAEPGLDSLNAFTRDIRDSVHMIRDMQDSLGELHLVAADKADGTFDQRLISEAFFDGIGKEIADKYNIGIDLMTTNRVNGMYVPIISAKTVLDHNVILKWFGLDPNTEVSKALAQRMTKLGRDINKTLDRIKNGDALSLYKDVNGDPIVDSARALNELHSIHDMITVEINKVAGVVYMSPVLKDLKKRTNLLEQYAVLHEMWKIYANLVRGMNKVEGEHFPLFGKLAELFPERALDVRFPQRILNGIVGDTKQSRAFKLEPADPEMRAVLEYFERQANLSINNLEVFEQMQEETVNVARLKRLLPVYRPLAESFRLAKELADKSPRPELAYTYLRMPVEAMNEMYAYQKVVHTLNMPPSNLASYLWHYANGRITFKESDLISRNYFKRRNGIRSLDVLQSEDGLLAWQNILSNKAAYEAEGISFKVDHGRIKIYIKEADLPKFVDRPYERIDVDFNIDEHLNMFVNAFREPFENLELDLAEVKGVLESIMNARTHLLTMAPEGIGSTLEKMDAKVMEGLMRQLDVYLPGATKLDTLRLHNRFSGNSFNHSVLGSIDSRRELMPYTSFNPAKTMFHAAEFTHDRVSKQTQFTMLLQDPLSTLSHVAGDMDHEQIFSYMKNAPHLKLGFLQADKRRGFKMSTVILNSPKDVQFAMDMNAVVLDRNTFVKAYEVINDNRIPEGLFKFLEHAIVAPFKIGWMAWNIGTIMRNFADSGLKNLQSTGDLRILPEMAAMFKSYWNYKMDIKDIMKYATDKNLRPDLATLEFFRNGSARTDLATFQLIDEFKKSGSSSGMVREMQEYYGDAIQRLYRHLEHERSGLSAHEFRMVMRMETGEASTWLKRLPQLSETQYTSIMSAKADLTYYKRAYAMSKRRSALSKHLAVEDFVTYLKRGNVDGFIPPELTDEMNRLMDATKNVSLNETAFEKFMGLPIVDKALDWNGGIEEVMRLSMFKYLKDEGYSVSEAMAEIIKTHFDYGHKTQTQMWIEMIMPFSTFRLNSFLYWVDELSKSSMGMEIISKYWREASNMDERNPEDFYLRRGLQYQMLSGNPVLNSETGLSLKLSPSIMDALAFTQNPLGYVGDSVFMVDEVKNFITMESYKGESAEDYNRRKIKAASKLIPFVGTWIDRALADKDKITYN